ncbi:MAG: hypothetical protein GX149_01310 [Acholeplasmataceae bacterium]|nr:hypothetical protein [Acholeplasmataceae bacterium]
MNQNPTVNLIKSSGGKMIKVWGKGDNMILIVLKSTIKDFQKNHHKANKPNGFKSDWGLQL